MSRAGAVIEPAVWAADEALAVTPLGGCVLHHLAYSGETPSAWRGAEGGGAITGRGSSGPVWQLGGNAAGEPPLTHPTHRAALAGAGCGALAALLPPPAPVQERAAEEGAASGEVAACLAATEQLLLLVPVLAAGLANFPADAPLQQWWYQVGVAGRQAVVCKSSGGEAGAGHGLTALKHACCVMGPLPGGLHTIHSAYLCSPPWLLPLVLPAH